MKRLVLSRCIISASLVANFVSRQSLSSVIHQNLIMPKRALLHFFLVSVLLQCYVRHHRPTSETPLRVAFIRNVLLLLFLSTGYFIYCFHFSSLHPVSSSPFVIAPPPEMQPSGVRQIPDIPGSRLMMAKESYALYRRVTRVRVRLVPSSGLKAFNKHFS